MWYSGSDLQIQKAIDICSTCSFKMICLKQAEVEGETYGVWGGQDFGNKNGRGTTLKGRCQKGLHAKEGPGSCIPCERDRKASYKKANKPTETPEARQRRYSKRRRNEFGKECRKGHMLTPETAFIRKPDGAVTCRQCFGKNKPVIISKEVMDYDRSFSRRS